MNRLRAGQAFQWMQREWRRISLFAVGGCAIIIVAAQLIYPWDKLPLYAAIDGSDVGGKSVKEATDMMNKAYQKLHVGLYFGDHDKPYRQPVPADLGMTIDSTPQVEAQQYPFWLRIIPTSIWWAHTLASEPAPHYKRDAAKLSAYIDKELGKSCDVKPQNSTIAYKDKKLQVIPSVTGGTCKLSDVETLLGRAVPRLEDAKVRIPTTARPAVISDKMAGQFATALSAKVATGLSIAAGGATVIVDKATLLSWLDFKAPDTGLVAVISAERSADFFAKQIAPKVAVAPGTSKVTTLDFTEIARQDGPAGQELDSAATLDAINKWLAGSDIILAAKTRPVPPKVVYTRTYSPTDTGLTALITQFAQSHPGSFGVSFAELDGKHRRAVYQDATVFRTASTYKLFVAYGTLKRIESGQWHWSDQVQGGRDLTKCFDDMIVKSDNACGETLLSRIGYKTLTNEIQAVGLSKSSFLHDFPETTAGDLTTFVGALQSGQLLSPSSTNTLLSAMKRNIYRQGIPAGANGQTADKVGFLNGLLHDAAVVYSPSGAYALTIMTDGSSWGTIAELTRQIEALRSQS